jgi:hypothetical protein
MAEFCGHLHEYDGAPLARSLLVFFVTLEPILHANGDKFGS